MNLSLDKAHAEVDFPYADVLGIGLIALDADGRVTLWNQWVAERSGIPPQAAQGNDLLTLFPGIAGSLLDHSIRIASEGTSSSVLSHTLHKTLFPLTTPALGGARESIKQSIQISAVATADGRRRCLIQIYDITQRWRREQMLIGNEQRLQATLADLQRTHHELALREKMASLGTLVAGVAHELNTPLGTSLTVGTTLMDKLKAFDAVRAADKLSRTGLATFAKDMREGMELLLRNLDRAFVQVRRFKQVSADQASDQRRECDLLTTIEDIVALVRPVFAKTPHRIVVDIPQGVVLDSYPGALDQVVGNLVLNSLHHGFSDTMQGEVRVAATLDDTGHVQLQVSDNGAGIPAHVLPRVFDPFFTTRLGQGGSGLGLNIVFNIVSSVLGGSIHAESEPGVCTTFHLRFPRIAPLQVTE